MLKIGFSITKVSLCQPPKCCISERYKPAYIGAANAFNFKEIKHLKGAITWGVARGAIVKENPHGKGFTLTKIVITAG